MPNPEEIFVLGKQLRLLQAVDGFRTCLDSVLLAAACPAQPGDTVLDLGAGVGGAGLCVLFRVPDTRITGVEIQADQIPLAEHNAALNNMSDRATFINSDIRDFTGERHNHVIINPPYLESGAHIPSPSDAKAKAHGHDETTLADFVTAGFRNLKSGGTISIIHRADQSDKIIHAFGKKFGGVEIIPLWPRVGVQAKRVIIRGIKDRKTPATLHAGLVLHQDNGDYTPEAEAVLRKAAPLLS